MSAPKLIAGIVQTAVVLNLPVVGPTYLVALMSQDVYLAGAYLLLTVILLLVGNFIADLALAWIDPRIRYD
jgi:peptide/nickel transport system permease protein